jgi:hypothetical protein
VYGQLIELAQRLVDNNIPKDLDIGVEMSVREGLKDVIGRIWWRRTWMLQEISAHDKPTFSCGEFASPKSAFQQYRLPPLALSIPEPMPLLEQLPLTTPAC